MLPGMNETRRPWLRWLKVAGIVFGCVLALVASFVAFVNAGAPPAADAPTEAQLDMLIPTDDGRLLRVRDIAAALLPDTLEGATETRAEDSGEDGGEPRRLTSMEIYVVGIEHAYAGRLELGEAILLTIPRGDPQYARAQRQIARWVYLAGRNDPKGGVRYATRAMFADPIDPKVWEDVGRVYLGAAGLD